MRINIKRRWKDGKFKPVWKSQGQQEVVNHLYELKYKPQEEYFIQSEKRLTFS